jgi:seryl-tRNA synthetase
MLDIKFIREYPSIIKNAIEAKKEKANLDHLLELDIAKRKLQYEFDQKRAYQNSVSKEIPILKKQKKDVSNVLAEMKEIAESIKQLQEEIKKNNELYDQAILTIPNIPDNDVPHGFDESANLLIREWGEPKKFTFQPLEHTQLAEQNGLLDPQRATKISGSGFMGYTGKGAQLERALINFMLDFHIEKHGYSEISLPVLVNRSTMTGTGQLPKLEEDMYRIEQDDLFLIPTAEVSVTNFYRNEILGNQDLPIKMVSFSPCFRREAGSYGKETKGLHRLHQFNKVEMVQLVKSEHSEVALEAMLSHAEAILQQLELPYRVVKLATGDLSFASAKTYDLEVWSPGANRFLEVSSVSNFRDFQARRALLRYRDEQDQVRYVHTLNGSGLATPRTMISILENYQMADFNFFSNIYIFIFW